MNIDMTPEMRSRLESASINGCPIAKRVMEIIDRDIPVPDMLKGSWSTVRITNRGEFKYIRLDNHAENGEITRTSPYQFAEDVLKSVNDPLAAYIAGATPSPRVQLDFIGRFTSYFEYGHELFVKVLSSYEDIRKAFLGDSWGTFPANRGDNLWPRYLNERYAERFHLN